MLLQKHANSYSPSLVEEEKKKLPDAGLIGRIKRTVTFDGIVQLKTDTLFMLNAAGCRQLGAKEG